MLLSWAPLIFGVVVMTIFIAVVMGILWIDERGWLIGRILTSWLILPNLLVLLVGIFLYMAFIFGALDLICRFGPAYICEAVSGRL